MNNEQEQEQEQKVIRKKYSPQFKDQALERIAKDGVPQVAKDLGLAESLLYSWKARGKKVVIPLKIKNCTKQN
jgi:transposase